MKRFEFRLAPVLRIRRVTEEIARSELAVANLALRSSISDRDAERVRYDALRSTEGAESVDDFRAEMQRGRLAADSHAVAQAKVAAAAAAAAMAQIAWSGAARDVAVLERLSERRHSEHLAGERTADATALDDLVNARHAFEQSRRTPGELG